MASFSLERVTEPSLRLWGSCEPRWEPFSIDGEKLVEGYQQWHDLFYPIEALSYHTWGKWWLFNSGFRLTKIRFWWTWDHNTGVPNSHQWRGGKRESSPQVSFLDRRVLNPPWSFQILLHPNSWRFKIYTSLHSVYLWRNRKQRGGKKQSARHVTPTEPCRMKSLWAGRSSQNVL